MKRRVDILIYIYFYLNLTILKEIVSVADPETGNILSAETLNMIEGKDGGKENETFTRQVVSMATGSPPMNRLLTSGQVVHPSPDNSGLAKIDSEKETDPEDLWSFIPIRGNKVLFVGKENMCLKRNGSQISLETCPKLDKIVPKEFEWLINIQISKEDYDRCKTIVSEYEKSNGNLLGSINKNDTREPLSDKSAAPGSQQSVSSGNQTPGNKYGEDNPQKYKSTDEYSPDSTPKSSNSGYSSSSYSDKPGGKNNQPAYSEKKPNISENQNNQGDDRSRNNYPREGSSKPKDDYPREKNYEPRDDNTRRADDRSRDEYPRKDNGSPIDDYQRDGNGAPRDRYSPSERNDRPSGEHMPETRNAPRRNFSNEQDRPRDEYSAKNSYTPEKDNRGVVREEPPVPPKNGPYDTHDSIHDERNRENNSHKRSWYSPSRGEKAYSSTNPVKHKPKDSETATNQSSRDDHLLSALEVLNGLFEEYKKQATKQ